MEDGKTKMIIKVRTSTRRRDRAGAERIVKSLFKEVGRSKEAILKRKKKESEGRAVYS